MRFIVVLEKHSTIGQTFIAGTNDGIATGGHPILDCTEVDPTGPYLACMRDVGQKEGSRQFLLVPHAAVAYVIRYNHQSDRPMGFG